MKIAICPNFEKQESLHVEKEFCAILAAKSVSFYRVDDALQSDTDLLCVIGGDGTLFAYAPLAIEAGIPIWFINAGSVGFLAESSHDLEARIDTICAGRYATEDYDLLAVSVDGETSLAMNDVCLMRDTKQLQTITLSVTVGGELVARYRGDGALVCTARGSTGYAMSAGAAIMAPHAKGMMFTPICAHSMLARSVVFGEEDRIGLQCTEGAVLFVDGVYRQATAQAVDVTVSPRKAVFVVTERQLFFEKVNRKLL